MLVFTGMSEVSPDKAVSAQDDKSRRLPQDDAVDPSEDKAVKDFSHKAVSLDEDKDAQ